MSNFFLGLPFLLKSVGLFRSTSSIQIKEGTLPSKLTPQKIYRVKYFFNQKTNKHKPPTILLTHGMSGLGIDDVRMTDVALSLSSCGYNVVVPEFEEIKALKITPESAKNIKDIFMTILEQEDLNTQQIGFFSISFSAGYGLVAFTDPEISSKIKSIIAIGGFSELLDTCRFALSNYLKDDYPTNILFYNYLHLLYEDSEDLAEIFYQAALDNGLARPANEKIAPQLYEKLSKRHKEIFDRVKIDSEFRKDLVQKISAAYEKPAKSISPIYCIANIKAPICLIHGKNDDVIPESESLKLAQKLKESNKEYLLELTGLLSHGDKVPVWKQIGSLPGLANAFGYFFKKLNENE